ncbi:MAG TPA: hypothetical protein VK509_11500 [Polyangiales bacterium]|nr:hypothetical protein [Polyangiales bacterium]
MWSRFGTCFAAFLAVLGCSKDAAAHPRSGSAAYVVTLEDESGRELPTFHHAGQTFVLGQYGDRYNIRVRNQTGRRIEAVVTVDGRDVVSGRVGDFVGERGYLVSAYDELLIEGFRQNWESVAAFRFTSPGNSYSSRMGTPQNVGVVGVAVFPEREQYVRPRPQPMSPYYGDDRLRDDYAGRRGAGASAESSNAPPAPSSSAPAERKSRSESARGRGESRYEEAPHASRDNLGTEYGESVSSSSFETSFVRADSTRPSSLISLRYDDRAGLHARGVLPSEPPHVATSCAPQAFPRNRFAPPPPDCRD